MKGGLKLLVVLLAVFGKFAGQNYVDENTNYCLNGNVVIYDKNFTYQILDREREKSWNNLQDQYQLIFDYIKYRKRSSLVKATLPFGALLIVMMGLSFISMLIFIVFCFGVCRKGHNRCLEEFTTLWVCILFWVYIGLYATVVTFVGLSVYWGVQAYCSYLVIPELWYIGTMRVKNATNNYMGLYYANSTLTNFALEIKSYTPTAAKIAAYNGIITANLQSYVDKFNSSLILFYNDHVNRQIYNVDRGLKKPRTIEGWIYPYVDPRIQYDAMASYYAARGIHQGAVTLRDYATGARSAASLLTNLNIIVRNYNLFVYGYNYAWSYFMESLISNQGWSRGGVWSMFAVTTALAIMLGIVTLIVFMICCYRKCLGCVWFARFLLIFIALFTIGIFVVALVLIFGEVILAGHCWFLKQLNAQFPNSTIIQDVGITINEPTRIMWRKCIDVNESPDILYVIPQTPANNIYFADSVSIIDGLSGFDAFNKLYTGNSTYGIPLVVGNWTRTYNGSTVDFNDVDGNLSILNQAVSCGNIYYAIKPAGCPNNGTTCISIFDTSSVQIPACTDAVNITIVQDAFIGLKMYATSMDQLWKILITNMTAGPWSNFSALYTALNAQGNNYNTYKADFPNTYVDAGRYNFTFSTLMNCTCVRKELVKAEHVGCFEAQFHVYVLIVVSIVAGMISFILMWCMWGALREMDNIEYAPPVPTNKNTFVQVAPGPHANHLIVGPSPLPMSGPGANYNFDDFENVPVY